MRNVVRTALVLLASAGAVAAARASWQPRHRYVPPAGFVPDSTTAVRIAVAIWTPIYGAAQIAGEEPYVANLRGGAWTVRGSLRAGPGGVAVAEIAKADARILRVSHSR